MIISKVWEKNSLEIASRESYKDGCDVEVLHCVMLNCCNFYAFSYKTENELLYDNFSSVDML